jgi:hypothetical protein
MTSPDGNGGYAEDSRGDAGAVKEVRSSPLPPGAPALRLPPKNPLRYHPRYHTDPSQTPDGPTQTVADRRRSSRIGAGRRREEPSGGRGQRFESSRAYCKETNPAPWITARVFALGGAAQAGSESLRSNHTGCRERRLGSVDFQSQWGPGWEVDPPLSRLADGPEPSGTRLPMTRARMSPGPFAQSSGQASPDPFYRTLPPLRSSPCRSVVQRTALCCEPPTLTSPMI